MIGKSIVQWYHQGHRDLPWRRTADPYRIMVSEFMLQQTRVETVLRYYDRFIQRFPDIQSLADAPESDIMAVWQGLGYYRRARNLHACAKVIVTDYNGILPDHLEQLRALPGIGDYMAGAISSIAFHQPNPAVDGNVNRVIARLFAMDEPIDRASGKKRIALLAGMMMQHDDPAAFTQAMMELGATVCTPKRVLCERCPLSRLCQAYAEDLVDALPLKTSKAAIHIVHLNVFIIRYQDNIMLEYRAAEGLLAKMWGLPNVVKEQNASIQAQWKSLLPGNGVSKGHYRFDFTHRRWEMDVLEYILDEKPVLPEHFQFIPLDQLNQYAIPAAFQKIIQDIIA